VTERPTKIRRYWEDLSRLDPDTSIIDPNDHRGEKNRYLAWLRDRAFAAALRSAGKVAGKGASIVLDYGCGSGSASLPLLRSGYKVVGVDIAQGLLVQATKRCADHDALFVRSNGETLPLRPSAVDAVITYGVLIYLLEDDELRRLLGEMRSAMAPGAVMVLIEQAKRRRTLSPDGMKVFRTVPEWQGLLESAGFTVGRTRILRSGRFPTTPLIRAGLVPRALWPLIAALEGWFTSTIGVPPWDYVDVVVEARCERAPP
jgi:SAM-dependent methyltransferase